MHNEINTAQNINAQPVQGPGLETGRTEADALARRLAITQTMSKSLIDKSNELWARENVAGLPEDFVPSPNLSPAKSNKSGRWTPEMEPGKTWNVGDATPYDRNIGGKSQKV